MVVTFTLQEGSSSAFPVYSVKIVFDQETNDYSCFEELLLYDGVDLSLAVHLGPRCIMRWTAGKPREKQSADD